MFKKMLLLASMALAASAVAIPAVASAEEWGHEGNPIEAPVTIHLTGNIKFEQTGPGSPSMSCPVTANIKLTPGTTGHVTNFGVTNTAGCTGGGALAGCQVESVTSTASEASPWSATLSGGAVGINGFDVTNVYKKAETCPVAGSTVIDGGAGQEAIATPTEGKLCHFVISGTAAGSVDLSGTLTATTCTYEII